MKTGQTIASYITLKNTGTKTWDSKTRLGTTQPRDRASAFADSSWIGPNRPAGVSGTVAPGSNYKFSFNLHAPDKPGTYYEYFGVVEEGVTWFSDPSQGGPPDNQLEVQIKVVQGSTGGSGGTSGAGGAAGAAGEAGAAGAGGDSGSGGASGGTTSTGGHAGTIATGGNLGKDAGTAGAKGDTSDDSGGCSLSVEKRRGSGGVPWALLAGIGWIVGRRIRRSTRLERRSR
jgi:hypothetical protein